MGIVQKDAIRSMLISYFGLALGYVNKGLLFLLILNTEQIGLINLLVAIGMLFAQFSNLGAIYTTWKFLPYLKKKENNHYGFLAFILVIVFIGIGVFTSLFIVFKPQISEEYVEKSKLFTEFYYWVLPIGIFQVLFSIIEVYLRSFLKNIISVFAQEIALRLSITAILILFYAGLISFSSFVYLHSLVYLIPVVILSIYLYRQGEFSKNWTKIQIPKRFKKILVRFSFFNYFNTLSTQFVYSLDVIMIAQIIGLPAAGVYTTVTFLASALQVPYKSIIRVSSPLIAEHWKHRELGKMKLLYEQVSSVSLLIGLVMFLVVWINIDFLFSFLKPEFLEGIYVFLFLMIGRLFDMYCGLNGSIFTTSKKYKYDIYFTIFLVTMVYLLNLWLIPSYGIKGAAISTSLALILYNLGRIVFVYLIFKIHPFSWSQMKVIALFSACIGLSYFTDSIFDNKYIQFVFQSTLIGSAFLIPIYVFNLEENSKNYLQKGMKFFLSKTGLKK